MGIDFRSVYTYLLYFGIGFALSIAAYCIFCVRTEWRSGYQGGTGWTFYIFKPVPKWILGVVFLWPVWIPAWLLLMFVSFLAWLFSKGGRIFFGFPAYLIARAMGDEIEYQDNGRD